MMGGTTYFQEQHRNKGRGGDIDRSVGMYDEQKCDEMEHATEGWEQYDTRNTNMIPMPSVKEYAKLPPMRERAVRSVDEVAERDDTSVIKYRVRKSQCVIHKCEAKSIRTSIKEWGWLEKKKIYGYKYNKLGCASVKLLV